MAILLEWEIFTTTDNDPTLFQSFLEETSQFLFKTQKFVVTLKEVCDKMNFCFYTVSDPIREKGFYL